MNTMPVRSFHDFGANVLLSDQKVDSNIEPAGGYRADYSLVACSKGRKRSGPLLELNHPRLAR